MAFTCDNCGKKFDMKKNLDYHTNNKKYENKELKCKYCENTFTSSSSMYRHISKLCKAKQNLQEEEKKNEEKDDLLQTMLKKMEEMCKENKQLKEDIEK